VKYFSTSVIVSLLSTLKSKGLLIYGTPKLETLETEES
jgi:hypothetical protein